MAKKNTSTGKVNSKAVIILLLVVLLALAGWLYYDNRNSVPPPVDFETETGAPPLPPEFTELPGDTPAQ